tara:strand:+ start:370 stop:516 length:147 start_codon:yes stop_codon:yes gene_type:complete
MKKKSWKTATSNSRAYSRGIIIGGWYGKGEHPLKKLKQKQKEQESQNE